MSDHYPFQARALMRFKAQDGQFVLALNQVVTVTAPTDEDGDWVDVTDAEGHSGSVPVGFLVKMEESVEPQCESATLPIDSAPSPEPTAEPAVRPVPLQNENVQSSASSSHQESLSLEKPHVSSSTTTEKESLPVSQASTSFIETVPAASVTSPAPPPPSKPNALRDRIAMFNKGPSGPPPPSPGSTRPKPPLARKPLPMPAPIPANVTSEPGSSALEAHIPTQPAAPAGMSAADAEETVRAGGSLKDRIRLLQQTRNSEASEAPAPPPKPKREWKRPAVPQSTDDQQPIIGMMPPAASRASDQPSGDGETADTEINTMVLNDTIPNNSTPSVAGPEEATADEGEDEEVARRRRIAERMAKLGGAKMGFGFPGPALGMKPPVPSKIQRTEDVFTETPDVVEAEAVVPVLPPERIAMPAIPKKAGPPRRKPPAAVPPPSVVDRPTLAERDEVSTPDGRSPRLESDESAQSSQNVCSQEGGEHPEIAENSDKVGQALDDNASTPDATEIQDHAYQLLTEHAEPHQTSQSQELSDNPDLVNTTLIDCEASDEPVASHSAQADTHASGTQGQLVSPDIENLSANIRTPIPVSPPGEPLQITASPPIMTSAVSDEDLVALEPAAEHPSRSLENAHPGAETTPEIPSGSSLAEPAEATPNNAQDYDKVSLTMQSLTSSDIDPIEANTQSAFDDDRSDSDRRESFVKKMAAIGARPMMPPISPRGQIRRPSGPRELNTPSRVVSLDESSKLPSSNDQPDNKEEIPHQDDPLANPVAHGALPEPPSRPLPRMRPSEEASTESAAVEPVLGTSNLDIDSLHGTDRAVSESQTTSESQEQSQADNDDDETARRRRLAERMAKMGARPMMGGMMPMLPSSGMGVNRRPSTHASSGSSASPNVPPSRALPTPPPVPPSRPLPSPRSTGTPPPDATIAPPTYIPSPPKRVAPTPRYTQAGDNSYTEIEDHASTVTTSSTSQPANVQAGTPALTDERARPPARLPPPPHSPASRPKLPSAYQNVPKRSSVLSQPGVAWTQEPAKIGTEAVEEDRDMTNTLDDDNPGPPPPIPAHRPSVPYDPSKETDNVMRPSSFDSPRSNDQQLSMSEGDAPQPASPGMLRTDSHTQAEDTARTASHGSPKSSFKARDLDLASERWWRTKPVSLPSSVRNMKDVLVRLQGSSTLQKGISTYHYELIVIRDDYSKTTARIHFQEGDDESSTEMTQTHYPPPVYSISALQDLSAAIGPQILARAKAKEDEKGVKFVGSEEDGKAFVKMILDSVGIALEPVGQTFGEVIYKCEIQDLKAAHPEIDVKDDIRPGDIVASYGATFKGKGIGHGSMSLGTVTNAHVAIVADHDMKKNKFKAYGIWHGKVELMSYRLDELKSGSIKVFRVLDKKILES